MDLQYQLDDKTITFTGDIGKNEISASLQGETIHFAFSLIDQNTLSLLNENAQRKIYFALAKDGVYIFIEGEKYFLKQPSHSSVFNAAAAGPASAKGLIASPMPGTIIKFLVKEGDAVSLDQGLVIVEAMKMENEIRAPFNAKVKKINFQPGDAVDVGQSIIDLEEIAANSE